MRRRESQVPPALGSIKFEGSYVQLYTCHMPYDVDFFNINKFCRRQQEEGEEEEKHDCVSLITIENI